MDLKLAGRRALVTGSTLGIGYAIAESLAREGAGVVVNGRTAETVERAVARIRVAMPTAIVEGVAADVATADGVQVVFGRVPETDVLINNLGIYELKGFFDIADDDWRRFFEVNVLSGIRLARRYAPGMRQRGWGRILFVSSESGLNIPVEMIHYGMTKTAQIAVARGLAVELAGTGVTVNSILPGPTRTEGAEGFIAAQAQASGKTAAEVEREFFRSVRPMSLLGRFAEPQEVANLAVYLSGEGASATTGAALRVEGGIINSLA